MNISMKQIQINGTTVALPDGAVAYKYADATDDARWIYDEGEAYEIAAVDPSLVVYPSESE